MEATFSENTSETANSKVESSHHCLQHLHVSCSLIVASKIIANEILMIKLTDDKLTAQISSQTFVCIWHVIC